MNKEKKQLGLPFLYRVASNREDFIIGESNSEVIKWIDSWPNWKSYGLIVVGPSGSGKSHLVNVWESKNTEKVINELLRIGKKAIVTIPNFGHWKMRIQLLIKATKFTLRVLDQCN